MSTTIREKIINIVSRMIWQVNTVGKIFIALGLISAVLFFLGSPLAVYALFTSAGGVGVCAVYNLIKYLKDPEGYE